MTYRNKRGRRVYVITIPCYEGYEYQITNQHGKLTGCLYATRALAEAALQRKAERYGWEREDV